ncbi:MAG: response regulator, partial [Bacteroidota bacterium]
LIFPLISIAERKFETKEKKQNKKIELTQADALLVEDIQSNREVIKGYLNNHPLKITEAVDGEQAFEFCKYNKPDLILMDIRLPGINGIETTHKIKGIYPKLPVIAVTASLNNQEEQELDIFDDYLQKPVCKDDLLKTMAKYIKSRDSLMVEEEEAPKRQEIDIIKTHNLSNITQKKLKEYHNKLHNAKESGNLDETAKFSELLIRFGKKYTIQPLVDYGEQLFNASEMFDIEEINILYQQIDQLFNKIINKKINR